MEYISGIVTQFGQIVADAEQIIADSIADNRIPSEPSITDRFLQELESSINRTNQVRGIQFSGITLSYLGPNADESIVGADFLAVLNIQIPGMSVSKGFLCQAKRSGRGFYINMKTRKNMGVGFSNRTEFLHLRQQVRKMLVISPDSFVCIYSNKRFAFTPALSIDGLRYGHGSDEVYAKSTRLFFSEFMMCFIGDRQLGAANRSQLSQLAKETGSRYALLVKVESLS